MLSQFTEGLEARGARNVRTTLLAGERVEIRFDTDARQDVGQILTAREIRRTVRAWRAEAAADRMLAALNARPAS